MNRKSVIVGGMAAAVLIVGGITAASSGKGSTATASVPAPAPAVTASKTAPPPTAVTTTVTRVIDGDTVETTDTAGTVLTIRIIGIDAPEMDTCEGVAAAEAMTAIALNQMVTLPLGGDGEDLDQHGRSLRYVDLNSNATDAGLTLIRQGHAVARYDSRDGYGEHTREIAYIAADALAPNYVCAPVPTQEPAPAPAPAPNVGSDNDDTDVRVVPAPAPDPVQAPEPEPTRAPEPEPASASPASAYYANCDAARAAGAAPLYAGEPGYSTKLDRDKDGVACE
ncbi:MAG TPA: excalibur calcium-binding domain-containing protein [Microlunatus sp.]|nr:excalibur calcium-binding domain-containing protein [Microlunatus sp.]